MILSGNLNFLTYRLKPLLLSDDCQVVCAFEHLVVGVKKEPHQ